MTREQLIDSIDKYYPDYYDTIENILVNVSGYDSIEDLPDDDPDEGFYSNFSTSELQDTWDEFESFISGVRDGEQYTFTLSRSQIRAIKTALEDFSDPSFTKDRELSKKCREALRAIDSQM